MKNANLIPGYDIRYTHLDDATALRQWLTMPGELHWFPMSEGIELENAIQCWISFCRWGCSLTATINNEPCGIGTLFLMPYRKVAHHCLMKLIVAPEYRQRGIGSSLLRNLKHLAKNTFSQEMVDMEVFEGNPIIGMLEKCDFKEVFRQEGFVKEGDKYLVRIFFEAKL